MDTRYLRTFREVAKWQSFTRAADVLGYAQSSVTTQIQNLESEFGATLFERWGRKIRLTQAGEQLLQYANQVLALMDEAKEILSDQTEQAAGTISIGTVESLAAFYLPPLLQTLRHEYPRIKLLLKPGICTELRQGVKEGVFDVAVIFDREQTHPDLHVHNLGEEALVVVAHREHPLGRKERVEVADFAGENWIFTEAGCSYRMMMETILRDNDISQGMSLEFGSMEAIKQCVAYGLGIALLPRIAVEEDVRRGTLKILPFQHPEIRIYKQVVYHKKKWISQPLRRFLQLLNPSE